VHHELRLAQLDTAEASGQVNVFYFRPSCLVRQCPRMFFISVFISFFFFF
jgi:hypothetical protein